MKSISPPQSSPLAWIAGLAVLLCMCTEPLGAIWRPLQTGPAGLPHGGRLQTHLASCATHAVRANRGRSDFQRTQTPPLRWASALPGGDLAARGVLEGSSVLRFPFGDGAEGQQGNERPHTLSAKATTEQPKNTRVHAKSCSELHAWHGAQALLPLRSQLQLQTLSFGNGC